MLVNFKRFLQSSIFYIAIPIPLLLFAVKLCIFDISLIYLIKILVN